MKDIKTPTAIRPEELVIVGIDVPATDGVSDGPRQGEEIEIDPRFVKNIAAIGVLEPVLIRRRTDGRFEVVEGRRRVRAARVANIVLQERGQDPISVPVVLKRGSEADLLGMVISGNEFSRANSALTRAWAAQEYIGMGRSEEEAAVRFGVDPATIRNWIKLLDTTPKIQAAVQDGLIGVSGALELGKLPFDEQDGGLARVLSPGNGRVGNAGRSTGGRPTVSAKAVKKAEAERRGERFIEPPSKKILKKILSNDDARVKLALVSVTAILQWVVGDLATEDDDDINEAVRLVSDV